MSRSSLLTVTAFVEVGTGVALLMWPSAPLWLLLGVGDASTEALLVSRIAGAALLAIGVACWLGRSDATGSGQFGLVAGVLVYDAAAAGLLGYAGLVVGMAGPMLWPAVALHLLLTGWCVLSLRGWREARAASEMSGGSVDPR
jgi:hypothetical protein